MGRGNVEAFASHDPGLIKKIDKPPGGRGGGATALPFPASCRNFWSASQQASGPGRFLRHADVTIASISPVQILQSCTSRTASGQSTRGGNTVTAKTQEGDLGDEKRTPLPCQDSSCLRSGDSSTVVVRRQQQFSEQELRH
jgi:hypothetical protein